MIKKLFISISISAFIFSSAFSQVRKTSSPASLRNITVVTEPDAEIWLNGVSFGRTDTDGKILVRGIPAGTHSLRVRADGFAEATKSITAVQKGELRIPLAKTTNKAELAFQQAESEKSVELYEAAIELNPKNVDAYLGLARALSDAGDFEEAHAAIARARKIRPVIADASAIEGRIFKAEGDDTKAIEFYKRAIREGKGIQPEAHTGLALIYRERAEFAGSSGKFDEEIALYEESAKWFAPAVKQLYGSPDAVTIYQMYGLVFEKMERNADAIKVYEEFLRVFPDIPESTSVRSFIIQLKK